MRAESSGPITDSFSFTAQGLGIPSSGFCSILDMLILVHSVDWEKTTELSLAYFFGFLALIKLQVRNDRSELSG